MSKLDDLINKLCPDGVEWKKIGDIADITRGVVMSKDYINEHPGEYPVYSSQTVNNGEIGKIDTYNFEGEYLTWTTDGAYAGAVFYRNGKFSVTNVCGLINIKDKEHISTKYIKYILSINTQSHVTRGMGNAKLMSNVMASIEIPVPPLEIQNEIVRILDNFTELEEELVARRKQYEYYRDSLLSFDDSVEWKKLGDIATDIYRGSGIKRDQVTPDGIPCVRYGEIYTTYNIHFDTCVSHTVLEEIQSPKYFEHGDILFAITGESIEDIAKSIAYMGNDKCLAGGDTVVLKHKQNPKYLAFALSTTNAIMQKGKGKVKSKVVHSSVPSISEIEVPIPSLEEQEKIANILDNFLQLCNNLTSGLPAEIEARHKQYEYYRDKLLTFKRKSA